MNTKTIVIWALIPLVFINSYGLIGAFGDEIIKSTLHSLFDLRFESSYRNFLLDFLFTIPAVQAVSVFACTTVSARIAPRFKLQTFFTALLTWHILSRVHRERVFADAGMWFDSYTVPIHIASYGAAIGTALAIAYTVFSNLKPIRSNKSNLPKLAAAILLHIAITVFYSRYMGTAQFLHEILDGSKASLTHTFFTLAYYVGTLIALTSVGKFNLKTPIAIPRVNTFSKAALLSFGITGIIMTCDSLAFNPGFMNTDTKLKDSSSPDFTRYLGNDDSYPYRGIDDFHLYTEFHTDRLHLLGRSSLLAISTFDQFLSHRATSYQCLVTNTAIQTNYRTLFLGGGCDSSHGRISGKFPINEMPELIKSIKQLPPEFSTPPLNQLVIVSFRDEMKWITYTYDRATAPEALDQILKILKHRDQCSRSDAN